MPEPSAQLPESLWPTTKTFVGLIDGLHTYTGLPWWATLSLTAVGVRAALLPVSVTQMRASAALWSTWRQAQQSAAQRAASLQSRSSFVSSAAGSPGTTATVAAHPSTAARSLLTGAADMATPGFAQVTQRQTEGTLHGAAAQAALRELPSLPDQGVNATSPPHNSQPAGVRLQQQGVEHTRLEPGGGDGEGVSGVDQRAGPSLQQPEEDRGKEGDGQATNRDGSAGPRSVATAETLQEYWRLRAKSGAPHPAWIIASPVIQATVFGTSVFAARAMAASNWPGFASGGALWFPDLTKAAVVIHWGQDALSTAVAFPYGQIGAAMPIAVALALFANINMSFGRASPVAASDAKGEGAVAAYVMGTAKAMLEWVTVPVLAIALGLPHGALVYWLSSSTFSVCQGVALQRPEVRERLGLASPRRTSGPQQDWGTSGSPSVEPDINQLFVKAADARANGDVAAALALVGRIRGADPTHPRAHFAAAQLHAELKQWPEAEAAYAAATASESDLAQRARAWFGVGVAQHAQGDLDAALQAFDRASQDALEAADVLNISDINAPSAAASAAASAADDALGASFGGDVEKRVILARRTAVRALLAQAGTLKQLARLPEALQAALRAAELDESVRRVHVAPLEAKIAAARTQS